jgi:putative membrane protein
MVAWDLSMDPNWSTLDHAWIWSDGGAYFGVPLSNFFGWFLTAWAYYLAFAVYCRSNPISRKTRCVAFWHQAIILYAVCAVGNLLIWGLPMAAPVVADAAGRQWLTTDILGICTLVSLLVMVPFAVLALIRVRNASR